MAQSQAELKKAEAAQQALSRQLAAAQESVDWCTHCSLHELNTHALALHQTLVLLQVTLTEQQGQQVVAMQQQIQQLQNHVHTSKLDVERLSRQLYAGQPQVCI